MEEQLTCSICKKTWSRLKARGRKPLVCPACISSGTVFIPSKDTVPKSKEPAKPEPQKQSSDLSISKVHSAIYPKPSNYEDIVQSTKQGSTWKCPACGSLLTIYVPVSSTPTHRCTPDTVSVKFMERIS